MRYNQVVDRLISQPQEIRLLLVADREAKVERLRAALLPDGYLIETAVTMDAAQISVACPLDLAILWFPFSSPEALPELESLVQHLQSLEKAEPLPTLLIIEQYGAYWVEPAFRLGVSDVLTRPIHPLALRQRVRLLLGARQTEEALVRLQASELALKREEERFRMIADFTYDWEYWIDWNASCLERETSAERWNACLIYNSPSCERITAFPAESFVKNPHLLLDIVHPQDFSRVQAHFEQEALTGDAYSMDFRIVTRNGEERWIGHACQSVSDGSGSVLGRRVSNRDITERYQAQQALLRSERLAVMGRLVASLAHEINNPLQAMCASMDLVLNFPLPEAERLAYLRTVREDIERLMRISRNILDYSRPRPSEVRLTHMREMIDRALRLAAKQIHQTHVSVQVHCPDTLPLVEVAPEQIEQVCLNLIINALDFMPGGGSLDIYATMNGQNLETCFRDTGAGIPVDILDQIFEPFFTTKKDSSGLGLAICKNIIQRHGGNLTVQSAAGQGCVFCMTIPLQRPA